MSEINNIHSFILVERQRHERAIGEREREGEREGEREKYRERMRGREQKKRNIMTERDSSMPLILKLKPTKQISGDDGSNRLTPVASSRVVLGRDTILVIEIFEDGRVSVVVVKDQASADTHEATAESLATFNDVATHRRTTITGWCFPL